MKIFSMLSSTLIIVSLFQTVAESAAFDYYTFNNIQGEDPSRQDSYNIHRSEASNANNENNDLHIGSAYKNYNTGTYATNKIIPEVSKNRNDYNPGAEARNNSRRNYILVTHFFNHKNKTINNSDNKYVPEAYAYKSNGNDQPTPRQPNENVINNKPSTYYTCKDYSNLRDHQIGEEWYNNTLCEQYVCKLGEQNIPYTQTNRCGVFIGQPNCQIRQNFGKIYPSCCPVLYCNGRYKGPVIDHVRLDN